MEETKTPITDLTPVYQDPSALAGKAVLVHDPSTGAGIAFSADKLGTRPTVDDDTLIFP